MQDSDFVIAVRSALIGKLEELRTEVRQAAEGLSDAQLWQKPLPKSNSVGHLILHLTGNLNHFVGAQIGNTGYVRDREREFVESSPPARADLFKNLDDAVAVFRRVVGSLTAEQFMAMHPHQKFGSVLQTLMHIVSHFALHRGQISYLVRLVNPQE
jgi:uncharacterized damage-inducible protein DinB